MSWALRHEPDAAGITLDEAGWTEVDALLRAAGKHRHDISRELLTHIVTTNQKQRFPLSPDGTRIRANQGHSVAVDLGLQPQQPPATLYHGTADRFVASILRDALQRQQRHHVHLSADVATAASVGTRHGRLVLLRVDAARMHADGHVFYRSANGVRLVAGVPAQYLVVHEPG